MEYPSSIVSHKHFAAFSKFNQENPEVFQLIVKNAPTRKMSMKQLIENIRWSKAIAKLNNNFTPLYARLLIHHYPHLAELIELRQMPCVNHDLEIAS